MNTKEIDMIDIITDHNQQRFQDYVNEKIAHGWFIVQIFISPGINSDYPDTLYGAVIAIKK